MAKGRKAKGSVNNDIESYRPACAWHADMHERDNRKMGLESYDNKRRLRDVKNS